MADVYFLLLFLSLLPGLMIAMGLINIFKKDWAWRIVERRLRFVKPQRTPEWEISSTTNGVIMLVGGLGLILYIFIKISALYR